MSQGKVPRPCRRNKTVRSEVLHEGHLKLNQIWYARLRTLATPSSQEEFHSIHWAEGTKYDIITQMKRKQRILSILYSTYLLLSSSTLLLSSTTSRKASSFIWAGHQRRVRTANWDMDFIRSGSTSKKVIEWQNIWAVGLEYLWQLWWSSPSRTSRNTSQLLEMLMSSS